MKHQIPAIVALNGKELLTVVFGACQMSIAVQHNEQFFIVIPV